MADAACTICETPVSRRMLATAAAFLVARTGLEGPIYANLCEHCEHVFFTPLLRPEQLSRLYAGYRGPAYNEERLRHEPGYAPVAAEFDDPESGYHRGRKAYYDQVLPALRDLKGLVIDFGGHDGAFARHAFPKAKVMVLDENDERSAVDADDALIRADLVFATHVFEHVPRPLETLATLVARVRPGVLFFLEVPKEYGGAAGGTLPENFARLESALRQGQPRVHALTALHEHVAHFSLASLQRLAERAGLEVLETHAVTPGGLSLLARKPG
jgi:hypothetical protein